MDGQQVIGTLINTGVAGVVLLWFMFRMERRLEALTRAVEDLQRTLLLLTKELPPFGGHSNPRPAAQETADAMRLPEAAL